MFLNEEILYEHPTRGQSSGNQEECPHQNLKHKDTPQFCIHSFDRCEMHMFVVKAIPVVFGDSKLNLPKEYSALHDGGGVSEENVT